MGRSDSAWHREQAERWLAAADSSETPEERSSFVDLARAHLEMARLREERAWGRRALERVDV